MPKAKVPLPEINPATVKYTNTFSHIPVRARWAAARPVFRSTHVHPNPTA